MSTPAALATFALATCARRTVGNLRTWPQTPLYMRFPHSAQPKSALRQKENELKQANAELEERGKLLYKTKVPKAARRLYV